MTLAVLAAAPIIRLDEFEGPLDLLLQLVERRRLPIAELSLVAVADQYLAQVRAMEGQHPEPLAEFLAIGARLLLLKSRSLLPAIEPPDQIPEEESAEDLVRRLEVYRAFKLLAVELGRRDAEGLSAFGRGARPLEFSSAEATTLQAIAPELLRAVFLAVEARGQSAETESEPAASRASVAERIALIRDRMQRGQRTSWRDICGASVDEIVATLLAVLELVRRGEIVVQQAALFGPIQLELSSAPPLSTDTAESEELGVPT